MAAGSWKDWTQGELVTEALFQDIQDSIAFIYASESAANTALTNKVEGTQFYDTGEDLLKIWDGSSWVPVGSTKVKQIKVIFADETGNESTTSTDKKVTSLTGSITPSSSSNKILIYLQTFCDIKQDSGSPVSRAAYKGIDRNNTASEGSTSNGTEVGLYVLGRNLIAASSANATFFASETHTFVDSPATTSSTDYTFVFKSDDTTVEVEWKNNTTYVNTLILMEIETV